MRFDSRHTTPMATSGSRNILVINGVKKPRKKNYSFV
jgi:hypothetical protein